MAAINIKLGPIGDAFSSAELGLYLVPGNAAEIDDSIVNSRLINFSLTGFIVQITSLEYNNIKLLNSFTTNVPLNAVPTGQPLFLEPVESIVGTPPDNSVGKRYLVGLLAPGVFMGYKDYIAQSTGISWNYTKPLNGMSLPVYDLGISVKYTGTYPSGSWSIPNTVLTNLTAGIPTTVNDDLATEVAARLAADLVLQKEIDTLKNTPISISGPTDAAHITIADAGNFYHANQVEAALQEIGVKFGLDEAAVGILAANLNTAIALGLGFQFFYGVIDPDVSIGNWKDLYINTVSNTIWQKLGTSDLDAEWVGIYTFPIPTPIIPGISIPFTSTTTPGFSDWQTDYAPVYSNNAIIKIWLVNGDGSFNEDVQASAKRVYTGGDPTNTLISQIYTYPSAVVGFITINNS
jgi:hypothetical protein